MSVRHRAPTLAVLLWHPVAGDPDAFLKVGNKTDDHALDTGTGDGSQWV